MKLHSTDNYYILHIVVITPTEADVCSAFAHYIWCSYAVVITTMLSDVNHQNLEDFNEPLRGYTGFDLTICSSSHDSG